MNRIFITGDTHSDVKRLGSQNFLEGKTLTKKDYVIILGDFGLLWRHSRDKYEDYWLRWLDDRPWTTLFLDGNHENFDILSNLPRKELFGKPVGIVAHSIFHLKRGMIYHIGGKTILVIGGAHSHDRQYRSWGSSMWKEEEITEAEINRAFTQLVLYNYSVDYVLTHCAPVSKALGAMPQEAAHMWQPDHSEENLQKIFDSDISYKKWYCGHYHTNFGPSVDGKFECIYEKIIELK